MTNYLSKFGYRPGFDPDNRFLKQEYVEFDGHRFWVSTVDLGLDHSFRNGPPVYWETMIFAAGHGDDINFSELYCDRYTSVESALAAHDVIIEAFKTGNMAFDGHYFVFDKEE